MVNNNLVELSEAENELYDRQIRLWGLESQKRLRSAKILISGLNGLGAEITKNIILSGVNSVKLHDALVITEEDFCSQFLAPRSALGTNRAVASLERARALNPMVEISVETEPLTAKNEEFFAQFDVVVVTGANNAELQRINAICREYSVKFFASDVWGMFGFFFSDLQNHQYVEDEFKHKLLNNGSGKKPKSELVTSKVQRHLNFPPYSVLINLDVNSNKYLKRIRRTGPTMIYLKVLQRFRTIHNRDPSYKSRELDIEELTKILNEIADPNPSVNTSFNVFFAQISPAAAVVGGVLAQEIIKVVTKMEAPHRNVFLFDPFTCSGKVEDIQLSI